MRIPTAIPKGARGLRLLVIHQIGRPQIPMLRRVLLREWGRGLRAKVFRVVMTTTDWKALAEAMHKDGSLGVCVGYDRPMTDRKQEFRVGYDGEFPGASKVGNASLIRIYRELSLFCLS